MKLEQLLKTGRNIILSSIFALGINSAVNGQAASGFGTVFDNDGLRMDDAQVTYLRAESEDLAGEFITNGSGVYLFDNIDLITTVVQDTPTLE
ncbi:MAG: hypothetical protein ACOCQQ_01145, partial [Candidatus Nanoarchaeia archaeon]